MDNPLLNWDHDVNPTSQEEILANLAHHVARLCKCKDIRVWVEGDMLHIFSSIILINQHWNFEFHLIYQLKYRFAVRGPVRQLGIEPEMLDVIAI